MKMLHPTLLRAKRRTSRHARLWRVALLLLLWLTPLLSQAQPTPALAAVPKIVYAWGHNGDGQVSIPAGLSGVAAISAGTYHSLALKDDGTVVAWGSNFNGQLNVPAGLSGVTAIAAGSFHNLALKEDGTVVGWGSNTAGQLNIPAGLSGVAAIAAGSAHSLALKSDGTVVGWGSNTAGQLNVPAGLSGVTAIAASATHSLALKADGTVVGWGFNFFGQVTIPAGLNSVTAIDTGFRHSIALKSDGTVVAWGYNGNGQLNIPAGLSGVVAIAAGDDHNLALRNDDVVVAWGDNSVGQLNIPAGLSGVEAIAAGYLHNLAIASDVIAPTAQPSQSPAANANGWNNADVTVSWNWSDTGTGIDLDNCTVTSTSSGEGVLALSATCYDLGGNEGGASYVVQVDKSTPVVAVTGVSDGASYTVGNVPEAGCSTSDALSGVAAQAVLTLAGGNPNGTGTFTATCSGATDNADNAAAAVSVSYTVSDLTAPVAQPSQFPAANGNGWNNTDVTVTWNWTDGEAGIDPNNCTLSSTSSGEGTLILSGFCRDLAGNEGGASYVVQVDQTAPVVTITGVTDGASYTLGSVPEAGCSTDDALSGVAAQAVVSVTGGNPDGTGTFTATCSGATDLADNASEAVGVSYSVESAGVLVGVCGGYEVRQVGNSYSAAGWSGTIKVGSNGNNTLNGTSGPDLMLGLGGNDKLDGKGGDDVLCGGDGVDLLTGGSGNDLLDGGEGHDVLNGGSGDHDTLLAGAGNDVLLDGDGVLDAQGGPGTDVFTLALRSGWRNPQGQARFSGLTAGYGNDVVGLAIFGSTRQVLEISGDEYDDPASPQEGNKDALVLVGRADAASSVVKFEQIVGIAVSMAEGESETPLSFEGFLVDPTTLTDESGAEFLTEPVGGDEASEEVGQSVTRPIFLPVVRQ